MVNDGAIDPLRDFSEACREEFQNLEPFYIVGRLYPTLNPAKVVGGEGARSVLDLGIPLNQFFSVGTPADGTEVFMGALGSRISMCSNFLKSTG